MTSYHRRLISSDQLVKETTDNEVTEERNEEQPETEFCCSWARQMEEDLHKAAHHVDMSKHDKTLNPPREQWELLKPKPLNIPRIRKPVVLKDWFGSKDEDLSDSSASSLEEENMGEWSQVERKRQNLKKKQDRKLKLKEKTEELATKMQYMIGVGPIEDKSIAFFEEKGQDNDSAVVFAVQEYLNFFLDFNEEELDEMEIIETKRSKKDKIVYCVLGKIEEVKEIHYRRAASENMDLITRDFIPPAFWKVHGSGREGQGQKIPGQKPEDPS